MAYNSGKEVSFMSYAWFITFVVLLFIELVTVNLVSIWFAIGSLVAFLSTFLTDNVVIQIIVFVVVSIIALLLTKPIVKKFKAIKVVPTNFDRVIGKRAEVIKKITEDEYGEVKVMGNVWTAIAKEEFDVGQKVIVKAVDGVKLVVCKEEK